EDWRFHKRTCRKPEEKPAPLGDEAGKGEGDMDLEAMKRQMYEATKDQDPATAKQMQSIMAGMMGIDMPK
ncbi:unnamed protein product, partial [Prorocentrum cordatum]